MIEIIDIRKEFIDSFYDTLDEVAKEKKYLATLQAPNKEIVSKFVLDNIKNNYPQIIAIENNKVIGWCDLSFNWKEVHKHCGYLGMGILKEYRGKGIGNKLLKIIIEKAKSMKLERIELDVYSSNKIAIKLYKSNGFKIEGKKIKAAKIDNRYEDVTIMGLNF